MTSPQGRNEIRVMNNREQREIPKTKTPEHCPGGSIPSLTDKEGRASAQPPQE